MTILLALPVKSLLRFKSVCRSWHELVLSHRFINMHHDRSKRLNLICFYKSDKVTGMRSNNSISVSEDGIITELVLPPPTLSRGFKVFVAAACRGMVCFSCEWCYNSVVVWNIATREEYRIFHGIVERADTNNVTDSRVRDHATGFTFLPISNEYKLVRAIIYFNNTVFIKIMRWNNDCMSLIAKEMDMDFPYKITLFGRCLNANDAIHWLGQKIEGGPTIVITFDMIEDKFREICTPYNQERTRGFDYKNHQRKLALWNESTLAICGASYTSAGLSYQIWTLNDYGGASESWFNGEVVVCRRDDRIKIVLFDIHTNQIKDFPIDVGKEHYYSSFFHYKNSLVPLPHTINNTNVCCNKYCPFPKINLQYESLD
ncbi:unnamed protein product [Withania somnifera]